MSTDTRWWTIMTHDWSLTISWWYWGWLFWLRIPSWRLLMDNDLTGGNSSAGERCINSAVRQQSGHIKGGHKWLLRALKPTRMTLSTMMMLIKKLKNHPHIMWVETEPERNGFTVIWVLQSDVTRRVEECVDLKYAPYNDACAFIFDCILTHVNTC